MSLVARIEPVSDAVSPASTNRRGGSTASVRPTATRHAMFGHTRDISNNGVYMWSEQRFEVGQKLHLALEVPPDQGRNWALEIQCETEVLRVEPVHPRAEETGVAVRILRFEIRKVLSASEALFPLGDQTD